MKRQKELERAGEGEGERERGREREIIVSIKGCVLAKIFPPQQMY